MGKEEYFGLIFNKENWNFVISNISWVIDSVSGHISEMCIIIKKEPNYKEKKLKIK